MLSHKYEYRWRQCKKQIALPNDPTECCHGLSLHLQIWTWLLNICCVIIFLGPNPSKASFKNFPYFKDNLFTAPFASLKGILHPMFDLSQEPSVHTVLYQLEVHYSAREPAWCGIMTVHSGTNTLLCKSATLETLN